MEFGLTDVLLLIAMAGIVAFGAGIYCGVSIAWSRAIDYANGNAEESIQVLQSRAVILHEGKARDADTIRILESRLKDNEARTSNLQVRSQTLQNRIDDAIGCLHGGGDPEDETRVPC